MKRFKSYIKNEDLKDFEEDILSYENKKEEKKGRGGEERGGAQRGGRTEQSGGLGKARGRKRRRGRKRGRRGGEGRRGGVKCHPRYFFEIYREHENERTPPTPRFDWYGFYH